MPNRESFRHILSAGDSSSLGPTLKVVAAVAAEPGRIGELIEAFGTSDEEIVLQAASALTKVAQADAELVLGHLDLFLDVTEGTEVPPAQWTKAHLAVELGAGLSAGHRERLSAALSAQVEHSAHWLVISASLAVLGQWATHDGALRQWLTPQAARHTTDSRKTVSAAAAAVLEILGQPPATRPR